MTEALQIAQFCSSIAIVLLACFLIPLAFRMHSQVNAIGGAMRDLGRLIESVEVEAGDAIRATRRVAQEASQRMAEMEEVTNTVRKWTSHVNQVVEEVNEIVDPPLLNAIREARVWKAGATAFLRVFTNPSTPNGNRKDYDHVRR